MNVQALIGVIQTNKCKVRLKLKGISAPECWGNGAIIPALCYIEINGPWPILQVEWMDISPVIMQRIGRLVPPKQIDSLMQIEDGLYQADVPYTTLGGIIRVLFSSIDY